MTFSAYEIFSILTGITLVLCAAVPDLSARDRLGAVLTGGFFTIYGFYVASQTTGTYEFPPFIFVVPFAAVAYVVYRWLGGNAGSRQHSSTPTSNRSVSTGPAPTTFAGVHAPTAAADRRCENRDCDSFGKLTRRMDCLRCERPTRGAPVLGLGAQTPVPVRRFAHLETRWCADAACLGHRVRTADLICRRCRADTTTAEAATA